MSIVPDFTLVTLSDRRDGVPVWSRTLGWPAAADRHVTFDRERFRSGAAVMLDQAVRSAERPVVLIAEGAACFAAAWWARLTPAHEVARVAAALLFAPFSPDVREMAERRESFASPDVPLRFPSWLIDPDHPQPAHRAGLKQLAREWGGELRLQRGAPMSPAARAGAWGRAGRLIAGLTARVVVRDIALAHAQRR